MSTGLQTRRFPIWRVLAAVVALAVIAVVVVLVVDKATGGPEVKDTIKVGGAPSAVTTGLGGVWLTQNDGGTLIKVDPDSKQIASRPVEIGAFPQNVAVGEGSVWATGGRGGRLVRVDPKTNRVLGTVID